MTPIKKSKLLLCMLVNALLLVSCAGTPDTNPVHKAQRAYKKIENDTLVTHNAPDELKKAEEAVQNAKNAIKNNDKPTLVKQQALIAEQRVKIAKKKAELNVAENQVKRRSRELQLLMSNLQQTEQKQWSAEKRAQHLTNFKSQRTSRGVVLRFKNLKFNSEKASLKSNAEPPINELANFLVKYSNRRVLIEGYTDNTGSKQLNKKLSLQRANVIRDALISRGIAASRIKAVGMGEQYPIASNSTNAGRKRNRRVEVVISNKTGLIPSRQ